MKTVKRIERGWPGHFICSSSCLFRRNTLLECENKRIVVSTVGKMLDSNYKFVTIGSNRYYETMVFHAKFDGRYWDADVEREIQFDSPWKINNVDLEDQANDMHETIVDEITQKLISGELL